MPIEPKYSGRQSAGSLWTAGGIVASTGAAFGANLLMVAKASTDAYADVAVLTVTLLIVGNIFRLGADRIFIGEVRAATQRDGPTVARRRGSDILGFALLSGSVGGILIALPPSSGILDRALSSPLTGRESLFVGIWLTGEITRLVASEGHRSRYRFVLATIAGVGARAPLFFTIIALLALSGVDLQRPTLLLAAAVSSLAIALFSFVTVGRLFPWWRAEPIKSSQSLWHGHVAMLLTTLAAGVIGGGDVWVVGATVGHGAVARYAFAVTMVAGIGILSAAISSGLSPFLADGLSTGDFASVKALLVRQVRRSSALAILGYSGLLLVSEPLAVRLGGDSYRGVLPLVALLGAGQVVGVIAGPSGTVITVARMYRVATTITVSVALGAVVLESLAGASGGSELLIAAASGAATGTLHVVNNIVLNNRLGITTHALSSSTPSPRKAGAQE